MPLIKWTPQQRQAIETTGRSVLVTAAAGAGKTAVLAERCAYLVCEAPPAQRCNVDQLLVLTFTNAAAAEMRSRIVEAIRGRLADRPGDARLYEQVALVDAAQISTIHAFCLWMIRRWFSEAGIDPNAAVLDEEEAVLLRREALDELFRGLYAEGAKNIANDGGAAAAVLGERFRTLVDHYGLGDDRAVATLVLQLHAFVCSLPDPEGWLGEARDSLAIRPEQSVAALFEEMHEELLCQAEHCEQTAALVESGDPAGHFYGGRIREYAEQLQKWAGNCPSKPTGEVTAEALPAYLARFEKIRCEIGAYEFGRKQGPRLKKDSDPEVLKARDAARELFEQVKKKLHQRRLRARFAMLSAEEWVEGLRRIAPYVGTIVELVTAFDRAFQVRKSQLGVVAFADLERLAYRLLSTPSDSVSDDANQSVTDPGMRFAVDAKGGATAATGGATAATGGGRYFDWRAIDSPGPSEVAQSLQRRFAYVLVDEFQDINPIQRSIIELVSRESNHEAEDNLFVVGDVKQSIYRFRLAEPDIFLERLGQALSGARSPTAVALQTNFRSRAEILDFVNLLFSGLMRGGGGEPNDCGQTPVPPCAERPLPYGRGTEWRGRISHGQLAYDEAAELRPGRLVDSGPSHVPIEVHLLERRFPGEEDGDDQDEESKIPEFLRSHAWSSIEREAYLIATRIREWMTNERGNPLGRPMAYRDVAVLLRAAKVNAERIAVTLNAMGIPAHSGTGGSLFGALEVRDLIAALKVLDNLQQDIPLAGVLRSGIMGDRFNEDELVEMRCHLRDTPFHDCVRAYSEAGGDGALKVRIRSVLNRISRYRNEFRLRPLADALWDLYERQGFLAHACGLPNGAQRHANLVKMHELARKFSTFRHQGLARFLEFVESLEDAGREIATAPPAGQAEDVVRVMTIHQAKGLEFPVVFVAGLGTQFNLGDRSGRMIYEQRAGIGLRAVDCERMIEYPTAAHRRAAARIEQVTREEELRILYVALTRARDKLVLVASVRNVERLVEDVQRGANEPDRGPAGGPSRLTISMATAPLDWIIPSLASAPAGQVQWPGGHPLKRPLADVAVYNPERMSGWCLDRSLPQEAATRIAVAECRALPEGEPFAADDQEVKQVHWRIDYVYPHLAAATLPAVVAASEFRREDEEAASWRPQAGAHVRPEFQVIHPGAEQGETGGVERGLISHTVLQHLDFGVAVDADGLAAELRRMAAAGVFPPESIDLLDVASLEWFVATPLAQRLREAGDAYRREFQFLAKEPTGYVDPTSMPIANADPTVDPGAGMVLVRGVVDGILATDKGLELVDFKTDRIGGDEVEQRSEHYRPQMELYARAMGRIWRMPVFACRLVFLAAQQIVELGDLRLD